MPSEWERPVTVDGPVHAGSRPVTRSGDAAPASAPHAGAAMTAAAPGLAVPGAPPDSTGVARTGAGMRFTGIAPTLVPAVEETVRRVPDDEAVVDLATGERLTYRQLWDAAARVAGGLAAAGVGPGQRVAVRLPNGAAWCSTVLGTLLAGAVPVPVNTRLTRPEIAYIVGDAQAAHVVEDPAGLPDGPPLVRAADDPEATAALFYTSGTTGNPKGAMLSHRSLLSAAEQCRRVLRLGPTERTRSLIAAPLFHVLAFGMQWLPALLSGGTVVIATHFETGSWLRAIRDERIDALNGVPAMYWQALRHPAFAEVDVSGVRLLSYGAAPTPPSQVAELLAAFPTARFSPGYGLTEASAVTGLDHDEVLTHADSVGVAVPATELRLEGPDSVAGIGQLLVRGPQLMSGYWQRPEASAEALDGGWLRTGDLARVDGHGRVHLLDRIKDMINRGGENVFSIEVERVLAAYPGVGEVAVVGLPDPKLGQRVAAAVVARPGTTVDPAELLTFARDQLADFKIPQFVATLTDPLPRNAAGKVDKAHLRTATDWGPRR
ncbi:putative fatty-acid--CoA ligase [Frankia canadensis]|uniref:Putative fatty-acid--CoA ligase n=1 Tax=Frankia canadensis TaxID=1836972 RepID=A0A2I2KQL7_9ACTN|nr:AMP-binding protein [Frankia canadensis]SNQ47963.1 putative fatty-acid--CoA ligase [Frankia canadensis]SOU55253.1 putative fatty-acid--CoA ligase [Frankia canadensis]